MNASRVMPTMAWAQARQKESKKAKINFERVVYATEWDMYV